MHKARMTVLEKFCEAVEVGERGRRPLKLHLCRQGLNADVPQVRSHPATSSWANVGSPACIAAPPAVEFRNLLGGKIRRGELERGHFGQELCDRQSLQRRAFLERRRRIFVNLDRPRFRHDDIAPARL